MWPVGDPEGGDGGWRARWCVLIACLFTMTPLYNHVHLPVSPQNSAILCVSIITIIDIL